MKQNDNSLFPLFFCLLLSLHNIPMLMKRKMVMKTSFKSINQHFISQKEALFYPVDMPMEITYPAPVTILDEKSDDV